MIEIYLLEQLDAFQRCGTLSKAAEELHISQPALSRSMKKLEEKMGLSLFDRDNRKIALNKTGELTAVYARNILEEERKMIAHVTDFDRSLRVITLGACATVPITHLMPLLQQHFPEKSILAETADDKTLITRLKNRSSQLVVLHELPSDKSLFCQRYLHEQLYISLPKDSPLSGRSGVSMKDLKASIYLCIAIAVFGWIYAAKIFQMQICLSKTTWRHWLNLSRLLPCPCSIPV